jgi:hypothetical protein
VAASKKAGMRELKGKPATAKKSAKPQAVCELSSDTITIDRRASCESRQATDRRVRSVPVAVDRRVLQRREKVNRRRQIDPTTCERDYTLEEVEFMGAMDNYKRRSGRMFPTCSEVLEVLKSLGYEKRPEPAPTALPVVEVSLAAATTTTVVS